MSNWKNWQPTCPTNQWSAPALKDAMDFSIDMDPEARRMFTREQLEHIILGEWLDYMIPAGNA